MRFVTLLWLGAVVLCGCQSRRIYTDAVLRAPIYPHVILESVEATKDSAVSGYPTPPLPMPVYPFEHARMGIEGLVLVRLTVAADGRVKEATIIKSSEREFEEPVLAATKHWKFTTMPEFPPPEVPRMILDCTFHFSCEEEPNKAPEPTTTSVTSPAGAGAAPAAVVAHL
jgi:TonB family protein